jgi:hypothetical protein
MRLGLNPRDTLGPLADSGGGGLADSFVPLDECAQRMNLTVEQVSKLVRSGVLRSDRWGFVQPAIISGAIE